MGIDFRGKDYRRDVSIGKRTIKAGEAAVVWDQYGQHHEIIGPKLTYLWFSSIRFLDKIQAQVDEYLVITDTEGKTEHKRGPCAIWENPVKHLAIKVMKAYSLLSISECVVVTKEVTVNEVKSIQRCIIRGPNLYFPAVGESIMKFSWSAVGESSNGCHTNLTPNASTFEVLRTNSKTTKIDVPMNLSSKMNGTIQLTFSFIIEAVELLVDHSPKDLIKELYDAVVIDVNNFAHNYAMSSHSATTAAGVNGSTYVTDMTSLSASTSTATNIAASSGSNVAPTGAESFSVATHFASMDHFTRLQTVSQYLGVNITNVAFRGFKLNDSLLRQQQELIELENRLTKDRITIEQKEKSMDIELTAKQTRLEQENQYLNASLLAKNENLKLEYEYKQNILNYELALLDQKQKAELEARRLKNNELLKVLKSMKDEVGVDINELLKHYSSSSNSCIDSRSNIIAMSKSGGILWGTEATNSDDIKSGNSDNKEKKKTILDDLFSLH